MDADIPATLAVTVRAFRPLPTPRPNRPAPAAEVATGEATAMLLVCMAVVTKTGTSEVVAATAEVTGQLADPQSDNVMRFVCIMVMTLTAGESPRTTTEPVVTGIPSLVVARR